MCAVNYSSGNSVFFYEKMIVHKKICYSVNFTEHFQSNNFFKISHFYSKKVSRKTCKCTCRMTFHRMANGHCSFFSNTEFPFLKRGNLVTKCMIQFKLTMLQFLGCFLIFYLVNIFSFALSYTNCRNSSNNKISLMLSNCKFLCILLKWCAIFIQTIAILHWFNFPLQ